MVLEASLAPPSGVYFSQAGALLLRGPVSRWGVDEEKKSQEGEEKRKEREDEGKKRGQRKKKKSAQIKIRDRGCFRKI